MEKLKVLSLDRIMELFEEIPDPRRPGGNIRHKLVDLLVIILHGVISGFETWLEIAYPFLNETALVNSLK